MQQQFIYWNKKFTLELAFNFVEKYAVHWLKLSFLPPNGFGGMKGNIDPGNFTIEFSLHYHMSDPTS